eukprot:109120-Karenia_brevis.AAC.1
MWLQPYGGTSPKGSNMDSTLEGSMDLWRPLDRSQSSSVQTVIKYIDSSGQQRVQGAPELKGTQSYPIEFGRAVASKFSNRECMGPGLNFDQIDCVEVSEDLWEDANLSDVLADAGMSL